MVVPKLHSPGPAWVTKLNAALGVAPHSFSAVTRHHSCVLSGSAAVGWKLVVVTLCERMTSVNAASVAISMR